MFSDNKKSRTLTEVTSNQNIIAKGTSIVGDLTSEGDFRIDGSVEGNIKTKGKIVVGKTGVINGSLQAVDGYFEGRFKGQLNLSGTLTLKSTADIEGEVEVAKLTVEPGAVFNVSCAMKGYKKDAKQYAEKQKQAG